MVFEEYVGLQSHDFSVSRTPEQTRMAVALAHQMKTLPNSQHRMLDGQMPKLERGSLDLLEARPVNPDRNLSLDQLASLLMMTAGVRRSWSREGQVKRWAPTAGNLGSVELFVAARNVEGLTPGFYFYQPREHSLASFRRYCGTLEIEEFMGRVTPVDRSCLPDALVLFTGAYHRLSQKYGPFAYRLINLDAGVALSQLHFVAQSLNIRSLTMPRWADDLIAGQLNLELLQEQSTAVAALFAAASGIHPDSSCASLETPIGLPRALKTAREFCEVTTDQVFEMLYRESRVPESELRRLPSSVPSHLLNPGISASNTMLLLPRPAHGGRLAGEILAGRTSVRNFTTAPVTLEQLATMLFYAHHGDQTGWPAEHQQNLPLTFLALVRHVEGIAPGVYQYNPENHGLSLIMAAPSVQEAADLFVQEEFTSAPLVVWIAGNLAAAGVRHGAFGHRQLLLRAGAAGYRLWIAALAMGLSGSLVSGLVPGAARWRLGLNGYTRASLFAFVTGHETTAATFGEPLSSTSESIKLQ
jgi:SagB-type dehydrogenase family enzyme